LHKSLNQVIGLTRIAQRRLDLEMSLRWLRDLIAAGEAEACKEQN